MATYLKEAAMLRDEAIVLRNVLRRSRAPRDRPAWEMLSKSSNLFAVAATFFLLDVEPTCDIEMFAVYTLRRLIQNLTRKTEQVRTEYQGRVRGQIGWTATYKARYAVHLQRARMAKLDEYRRVVQIYERYERTVAAPSWERIEEIGRRMLPLPGRVESNADIWLALGADILRGR